MYTVHKNVQVILALLKKFGIRHLVLSAGTRHIPLAFSAEDDDFFKCYSVVDERSAGFFALGIIQTMQEPACIVCTSGTATCNYVSAVNEAFYQHLPLVVLTSDRNRYYLNQQEDQCIPQLNLFKDVARKIVDLPIVRDDKDFKYCARLVNEALLELDHREKGPVHINFQIDDNYPVELGTFKFELQNLPDVIKINRLMATSPDLQWDALANSMSGKRIVILYGQHLPIANDVSENIQRFCQQYNAVVVCDHLSNLPIQNKIENATLMNNLHQEEWNRLCPDIVITMNGHRLVNHKNLMKHWPKADHWHVSPDGMVSDPFNRLSHIIECPIEYFFERLLKTDITSDNDYYSDWVKVEQGKNYSNPLNFEYDYSAVYAVQGLINRIPKDALLHISNSNSVRISNIFPIPPTVDYYCNRGTCGIDGSMSTYIAQSLLTERPSFMVIGDLSFFYDMNALWNRYSTRNTRIMLCNNSGGALFHSGYYKTVKVFPNIDNYIAAAHETSAEGWARSRGFDYLCAHNKEEYSEAIARFVNCNNTNPLLFEVFTDKETDIQQMLAFGKASKTGKQEMLREIKEMMPKPIKNAIEKILK